MLIVAAKANKIDNRLLFYLIKYNWEKATRRVMNNARAL